MPPRLIDSHTHLNFQAFMADRDEVIERTLQAGVWMVNVGTQFDTSRKAVEIAEQYADGVYATIGLHPIHLFDHHVDEEEDSFQARGEVFNVSSYKDLALRSTKVAAVGEFGLDYYRVPEGEDMEEVKKVQREVVKQHMILAREIGKPLMIHCRQQEKKAPDEKGAYDELLDLLEDFEGRVNIHSFTGSLAQAQKFIERGYTIGINGIVTFDKTGRSEEIIKNIPLDRILLETDAPYLSPEPVRGKRNEPMNTEYVAQKIAEIKKMAIDEVERQTTKNAREFFNV